MATSSPQDVAHALNQRIVLISLSAIAVMGVFAVFLLVLTHTNVPDQVWGLVGTNVGVLSGMLISTRPGAGSTVVVGGSTDDGQAPTTVDTTQPTDLLNPMRPSPYPAQR